MTAMHVTVHTRDDGVTATVQERDQATWLELRSGGQTVTIFVKDVWELVALADRIILQVEDKKQMQILPRAIDTQRKETSDTRTS